MAIYRGLRSYKKVAPYSTPVVIAIMTPQEAYDMADYYEGLSDGVARDAPALRTAADEALGCSGARA